DEVDVNVKTVDVSPLAGVQLKFAYGGVFAGGGGGGGASATRTESVRLDVRPEVSIASSVTLYVPATVNKCWAVFATDHVVSHAPSDSQSHRTWTASGGSRSSATCAVKFTGVSVSGEGGVQEKFAQGGASGGGGGALYVRLSVW